MDMEKLKEYIEKDFSIRDIANRENVQIGTIQYWLKRYGLTTTYVTYRKEQHSKRVFEIASSTDKALFLDCSEVTIRGQLERHERTIKVSNQSISFLLGVYEGHKTAIFFMGRLDKQRMFKFVSDMITKYRPKSLIADKEFYILNDILPTFKIASWNCSQQINEKYFGGLKTKMYPIIRKLKDILGISYEKLMDSPKLVLRTYITHMRRLGYEIVNEVALPDIHQEIEECKIEEVTK